MLKLPHRRAREAALALFASAALVPGAPAQERAGRGAPEGLLDLDRFPADLVGQVVVPVPGEVFGILEKLGETDWAEEGRGSGKASFRQRTDYALALGVAVADGFVAVQAQDAEAVQRVGRAVLARSEALGLRAAVTRHCQAIFDAVEAGDWKAVRSELDKTEATARATMAKMGDENLATCVSLGGWVRGTEVASGVIARSFTPDKAELLNQPGLVAHFSASVDAMVEAGEPSGKLSAAGKALAAIGARMGDGKKPVASDAVVAIHEKCEALVDQILEVAPGERRTEG